MKLFEIGKKIKIRSLKWYKLIELAKDGVGQDFIFHANIPVHYTFWCKIC